MENNKKNSEILNDEQNRKLSDEELEKTSGGTDIFDIFERMTATLAQNREEGLETEDTDVMNSFNTNSFINEQLKQTHP